MANKAVIAELLVEIGLDASDAAPRLIKFTLNPSTMDEYTSSLLLYLGIAIAIVHAVRILAVN